MDFLECKELVVNQNKVCDYLLNPMHPVGISKANFFISLGFNKNSWKILVQELTKLAQKNQIKYSEKNQFGIKYIIDGQLTSPAGKKPYIRTVWFIAEKEDKALLVTAYPLPVLKEA
jgi:hypothetical protein